MTTTLRLYLIRPSRYDDEGFPVRHWRGVIPSNTLATLNGLSLHAAQAGQLGDVKLETVLVDECVQRVPFARIRREARRDGTRVVAALCGVQSNQFSRAADLGRRLRTAGATVLIGGFHVSGVNALLPGVAPEVAALAEGGVHVVRGEVDAHWPGLLRQALEGTLPPVTDLMSARPDLADCPLPRADRRHMQRFVLPDMCTIDGSRGCPFSCSFCTIINVQGRMMRARSPENILSGIEAQLKLGVRHFFFTDDNFARHPRWEAILDGMAAMRAAGRQFTFMMQVDTQAVRTPGFVEKSARAGCVEVFIGLESINPDNLEAAGKRQNRVQDFAGMVQAWREHGVITQCGYILGFPHDTPQSIAEDVRRLRDEVGIDMATFFVLTPLPGSADHANAVRAGASLDPDLNRYDSAHAVADHPRMTREQLEQAWRDAWGQFYTPEHMKRCLASAQGSAYWTLFNSYLWYRNSSLLGEHPMMSGLWRLKDRAERRPGMPRAGWWGHRVRRLKDLWAQLRAWRTLLPEMQELWLATRRPDPNEGRVKAIVISALKAKPRALLQNLAARLTRWRTTRRELSEFWRGLRRLRWWRANPLLAPWQALKEAALWTHFVLQVLYQADSKAPRGLAPA